MKTLKSRTLALVCLAALGADRKPAALPDHLRLVDKMIAEIKPEDNEYAFGKPTVEWKGLNGADRTFNRSDCTTYVTQLLRAAYKLDDGDFNKYFGSRSPSITRYYETAVSGGIAGFKNLRDLRPGDLVISKYVKKNKDDAGASGHMMIVAGTPELISRNKGESHFRLRIVDCTSSPHGDDNRSADNSPTGQKQTGVGRGTIGLFTDAQGNLTAWAWNGGRNAVRYDADDRPVTFSKIPGQTLGKSR